MKDHLKLIGVKLVYRAQRVPALVTVTDVREAYGRLDYEVEDVLGKRTWVSAQGCGEAPEESKP